jgi:[ribosomal protein S18]-alanine N-acetyltransferase
MNSDSGTASFRIHPANKAYAKTMAAIHAQCFHKGWSALEFESFFERAGVFAGVAYEQKNQPVGFIICWIIEDVCDLLSVGVLPEYRREGVGLLLLEYGIATARDMGAARIMLEVNINNAAAITMYEANGFSRGGLRPAYYNNPDGSKADALQLVRNLR